MEVNFRNESIKYGVIAGLLLATLHIGAWTMGTSTYVSVIGIESFTPYMIIIFLIAGFHVRKLNGGFLTFKEGMKFVFLAYVIVAIIEAINSYILFTVLDKDLTARVLEITREKTLKMMQNFGASAEQIKEATDKIDAEKKETSFRNIFLGTGMNLIWYFVKSMVIAIILKKEQKLDENFLTQ